MTVQNPVGPANPAEQNVILAVETSSRVGSAALALGPRLLAQSRFTGPMQHSSELFPAVADLLRSEGYAPMDIDQVHIAIGPGSFTGLRIAVAMAKAMHLANAAKIVTVDSLDVVAANLSERVPEKPLFRGVGVPPVQHRRDADATESPGQDAHATSHTPSEASASQGRTLDDETAIAIPDRIAALFDAKRGQFYAGVYERVAPAPSRSNEGDEEGPGYHIPGPNNTLWQKIVPDSLMTAREIVEGFAHSDRLGLLGDGLFYHRDSFDTDRTVILPERYWSPRATNVHRLGYQKALAGRFADPLALTPFYLRGPEVTLRKKP